MVDDQRQAESCCEALCISIRRAAQEMQAQMPAEFAHAIRRPQHGVEAQRPRQVVTKAEAHAAGAERVKLLDLGVAGRVVDTGDEADVAAVRQGFQHVDGER